MYRRTSSLCVAGGSFTATTPRISSLWYGAGTSIQSRRSNSTASPIPDSTYYRYNIFLYCFFAASSSEFLSIFFLFLLIALYAVSLGLTADQKEFQRVALDFAKKEMLPHAEEWDEKKIFPVDTLKRLAELGFGGIQYCLLSSLSRVN